MVVYTKDKFQCTGEWRSKLILYSPVPLDDITFPAKVKTATSLSIGDVAEFIQTAGDETDIDYVTTGASESKTITVIISDTQDNRNILARDNSVNSYSGLARNTAQFAADSIIDVTLLIPGMIINGKAVASGAIKHGQAIVCNGSSTLKTHPDDGTTTAGATPVTADAATATLTGYRDNSIVIGKSLAKVTSVASVQNFPVLIAGAT